MRRVFQRALWARSARTAALHPIYRRWRVASGDDARRRAQVRFFRKMRSVFVAAAVQATLVAATPYSVLVVGDWVREKCPRFFFPDL
jgi:hypothetical protein